jgi:hypothetical protein
VPELVGHHQGRDEAAEVLGQLGQERAVVGDRVGVRGGAGLAVERVVLRLQRIGPTAHSLRVLPAAGVAGVDAEVAPRQGRELLTEHLGHGGRPVLLEVGQGVAGQHVDGLVGGTDDLHLAPGHVDR